MELKSRPKTTTRKKKRVGRGYGSGKGGHTSGRGTKGQRSKGKIKTWFEGGSFGLIRRLPKLRGKGRMKPLKAAPVIVNLKALAHLPGGTQITVNSLVAHGIVRED